MNQEGRESAVVETIAALPGQPEAPSPSPSLGVAPPGAVSDVPESFSYIEVEVSPLSISVFERSGDGKTAALLRLLRDYGLTLLERVSSPCG